MNESQKRLLQQFSAMAEDGSFGDSISASRIEYEKISDGISVMIKTVSDFVASIESDTTEIAQIRNLACHSLIVAYCQTKQREPDIAEHFANSFLQDYPGIPQSSLMPRWTSLGKACLAFRELAHSKNRLLVWQQSIKLVQAYNEFLNGLFGYLIILWRAHLGKATNANVLNVAYGNKVKQLSELTGGDAGVLYFYLRIARPDIRNAIAHESIWLDSAAGVVRFNNGNKKGKKAQVDLIEFMGLLASGSHVAQPYLVAISTIAVMEFGSEMEQRMLPKAYYDTFFAQ